MTTTVPNSMLGQMAATFGAALEDSYPHNVPIGKIDVKPQERKRFEEPENTIADLAESIRQHGVIQPVLLRPKAGGRYELVAGERRLRAAKMANLSTIPCLIKKLDDAEARDARLTENIQRLNLTALEEAEALRRTLNDLQGDRAKLEQKYGKSKAWISQRLSLLDLPTSASRLIKENISADVTAINTVKQIEKINPDAAKKLVDDYAKKTPGAPGLREASEALRKQVKPDSKGKQAAAGTATGETGGAGGGFGPSVATPRDRSAQEPGTPVLGGASAGGGMGSIFPPAPVKPHEKAIGALVAASRQPGAEGAKILAALVPADVELIEKQADAFFKRGQAATDLAAALIAGLSRKEFGDNPVSLLNLVAFLQGQSKADKFTIEAAVAVIGAAMK